MATYCENYIEHINTPCGQIAGLFIVKTNGIYCTNIYEYALRVETQTGTYDLDPFAKLQKRLLASSYLSVRLSVRMEQLGSH
jgi:hypothetical protein